MGFFFSLVFMRFFFVCDRGCHVEDWQVRWSKLNGVSLTETSVQLPRVIYWLPCFFFCFLFFFFPCLGFCVFFFFFFFLGSMHLTQVFGVDVCFGPKWPISMNFENIWAWNTVCVIINYLPLFGVLELLIIYHFLGYSSLVSSSTPFFYPPWHLKSALGIFKN